MAVGGNQRSAWRLGGAAVLSTLVVCLWGCGGLSGGSPPDAGADADTGVAGSAGGSGVGGGSGAPACTAGRACQATADCGGDLCQEPLPIALAAQNLPVGQALESELFPGGACTPRPFVSADDPRACLLDEPIGRQGCGACGVCVPEPLSSGIFAACRERCEPSATQSGCSRPQYTCDFATRGCIEGCRSDEQCKLRLIDTDADGVLDTRRYDPTSRAFCSPATFRCEHPGTPGAQAGDPCDNDDDCEANGGCVLSQQTLAGYAFPGGYCTKRGCDVPGRACTGTKTACLPVGDESVGNISSDYCVATCRRGAEPESDVLGPTGHGAGCREGYRCVWDSINGSAGTGDNGFCVGGNYNTVTVNNVGAACTRSSECFSPYGHGQCLRLSVGGISAASGHCTVMDCAAPGSPNDVCGAGNECIGLSGDGSFCVQTCEDATECADGLACADDDRDPSSARICYPVCFDSTECRTGQTCSGNVCR